MQQVAEEHRSQFEARTELFDTKDEDESNTRPPSISILIMAPSFQEKSCPSSATSISSLETQSESPIKAGLQKVFQWKNKVLNR